METKSTASRYTSAKCTEYFCTHSCTFSHEFHVDDVKGTDHIVIFADDTDDGDQRSDDHVLHDAERKRVHKVRFGRSESPKVELSSDYWPSYLTVSLRVGLTGNLQVSTAKHRTW